MIINNRNTGSVAIVTGAAHGIGQAITVQLAADGIAVAAFDIDTVGLQDLETGVRSSGGELFSHTVDVGDLDALAEAFNDVVSTYDRVDVLVNNAATFEPDVVGRDLDIVSTPIEVVDRTMQVNLRGPYRLAQLSIPVMLSRDGGSIINISSPAATRGAITSVAYSASKAALDSLTRSIATSHGRRGIRCNSIAVGLVMTENARRNLKGQALESRQANLLGRRFGEPADVAALTSLLVSDAGAYINGQTITLDGGASAHQPWFSYGLATIPDYTGGEPPA